MLIINIYLNYQYQYNNIINNNILLIIIIILIRLICAILLEFYLSYKCIQRSKLSLKYTYINISCKETKSTHFRSHFSVLFSFRSASNTRAEEGKKVRFRWVCSCRNIHTGWLGDLRSVISHARPPLSRPVDPSDRFESGTRESTR